MKKLFSIGFIVLFLGSTLSAYAFTCDGIFHNGATDNSWFGDKWDDAWNLDWEQTFVPCINEFTISGENIFTVNVIASSEAKGCDGGDGDCCEEQCSSGAR